MSWLRIRTPVLSWRWLFLLVTIRTGWRVLRWLAVHPTVTVVLAVVALLAWMVSHGAGPWLLLAAGAVLTGWGVAMEARPQWYVQTVEALASWRRLREYRRQWEAAMHGAGLVRGEFMPDLLDHRWGGQLGERDLDVLTVAMPAGQIVDDWRAVRVRLAAAFGVRRLRAHPVSGQPAVVQLYCSRYRDLAPGITAQRVELHPTVQPSVQRPPLQLVDGEEPSTPVDQPVERPAGAFPRTPRRTQ